MKDLKRLYQGKPSASGIALAVGAVVAGGLLIYGSIPAEGQRSLAPETLAQADTAPAAPAAAPVPPPKPAPVDPKIRAAAVAAKNNIDVSGAWTRATPKDATSADIFLRISSDKDADRLLDAEAAFAEHVEVSDAAPKVGAAAAIDIPAGGTVEFTPGGRHIKLMGLRAPLKEGDSFLITLRFDKAGTENTAVRILGATATGIPPSNTRRGDTTQDVTPVIPH